MLIIAAVLFVISTYIGYDRQKKGLIADVDFLHAKFDYMYAQRGYYKRISPTYWIVLFLQISTIISCLLVVYLGLKDENIEGFILIVILVGIFVARFIISAFFVRKYMWKNHKQKVIEYMEKNTNKRFTL